MSGHVTDAINGSNLDLVRVYLIDAGWQMFLDHPVAGVGLGGYQHALTTTYSRFLPETPPATLSHTTAVTLLAEEGLVGVALFGGFLILLAREVVGAWRRRTPWSDWIVIPAVLIPPILAYSQLAGRMLEEPYLWLALGRKMDRFGVAAALEVKDPLVRPAMLIVADQPSPGVG